MDFDLNRCSSSCLECIKRYKSKHKLSKGAKFELQCQGIPKDTLSQDLINQLGEEEAEIAKSIIDPVTWAAKYLDWHCLDPKGKVWKRKNPDEYYRWVATHPNESIEGHSRYHRPYQAQMLRCSSQFKVSRIGRQAGKTEALCITILYNMSTRKNFKVVLLTPFQTQIEEIFGRLEELMRGSSLANSLARSVKAPNYRIDLSNGSRIKGFTAGTTSGGNANSVRGQPAEMLIFDEADYLSTKDIESAMSVTNNYPLATVWMSSTPQGKRDNFYKVCTHDKTFREFHFPASCNPMWTKEREEGLRYTMSHLGYQHEIEAEFGEQEEGVFQNVYVENAQRDYMYGEHTRQKHWFYMIGVDWNDSKNGTAICVTGLNPENGTFTKVHEELIQKAGSTQKEAMKRIIILNRAWQPAFIYVDRGYGACQIEMLQDYSWRVFRKRKFGSRHPDYRIKDILIPYDFASKVEINDPVTGLPVKKDAKPFLVECAVRRFENGDFVYSKHDDTLTSQLQAYIISKISVQGKPVYKPNNDEIGDHQLDALMLSLVGFTLHGSLFGKDNIPAPGIGITGRIGEVHHKAAEAASKTAVENRMPLHQRQSQTKRGKDTSKENSPTSDRMRYASNTTIFQHKGLPAYHTSQDKGARLWRWPGWGHDAPRPKYRLYGALAGKSGRPSRSKI